MFSKCESQVIIYFQASKIIVEMQKLQEVKIGIIILFVL
jgi:hypothetical protein